MTFLDTRWRFNQAFQLIVYISIIMSAVCLHFDPFFQLFVYISSFLLDVPFLSSKRPKPDVVRPLELATVQPLSASTPVLIEESEMSKNGRERVQRTLSEPPSAEPSVKNQGTRSWKTMQR